MELGGRNGQIMVPGPSRPYVMKKYTKAPNIDDLVETSVLWEKKHGSKLENGEPGRSRPNVVKSYRRAPDKEDLVETPLFWAKRGHR